MPARAEVQTEYPAHAENACSNTPWGSCPLGDDAGLSRTEQGMMPNSHRSYPLEFRNLMVQLVRQGRSPRGLAAEFGVAKQTVRRWVRQASGENTRHSGRVEIFEGKEVLTLCRQNLVLREEGEALSKMAARLVREIDSTPVSRRRSNGKT